MIYWALKTKNLGKIIDYNIKSFIKASLEITSHENNINNFLLF